MLQRSVWLMPLLLVLNAWPCSAAEKPPTPQEIQHFESKVRPILVELRAVPWSEKTEGQLALDSRAALLTGGDDGPAIVPGQPEKSLLLKAVAHTDDLKMPPSKKLSAQTIADLTQWVKAGAPWPGADQGSTSTVRRGEFQITDKDRAHWAFQPVKRAEPPIVKYPKWVSNPIDAFILAKLEAKGLQPNPPAGKRELIRRVSYDLTGLPPTPQEVEAFVNDASPTAYDTLIDRLLASERYGEKWGRHWLDLVRFAETNSYERDNAKPHTWRYRDYVIRSFNSDKPYDRFVREQLAGDELPDATVDSWIATGYYRLGIWDDEPTDRLQARYDGLDDIVATTGQTFLGLTFDCARCHDHKIDPIAQKDYYRLVSFFHNIHHFKNGGHTDEAVIVTAADGSKTISPFVQSARDPKSNRKPRPQNVTDHILCVTEMGTRAPDTFVLLRGNPAVKGDKVEPAFPQILNPPAAVIPPPPPGARTSGRRRVLADWIASRDNPLTARVMANRIWQHHFGRGIVRSASNFGLQGDRPTHPELLDFLAAELVAQGWHLKPLHRLILTSNAYRMSSRANSQALATDPANDLLWRFDMRRLSAEEIRDSILAVTGTLNLKMYGPGVFVEIPKEVMAGQSIPGYGWGKSSPEDQARRSIYIHVKRSLLVPILESFDMAETDRSNPVRFATTQPTQALGTLNGSFLNQQAAAFAQRLRKEAGSEAGKQVALAISLAASRPATDKEISRGARLMAAFKKDGASDEQALRYYCLLVLNLNEFVYLD